MTTTAHAGEVPARVVRPVGGRGARRARPRAARGRDRAAAGRCACSPAPAPARPARSPTGSRTACQPGSTRRSSVLAVTFTARAAGEMRDPAARASASAGVQARTFHAAALRQLHYFWPQAIGGELPAAARAQGRRWSPRRRPGCGCPLDRAARARPGRRDRVGQGQPCSRRETTPAAARAGRPRARPASTRPRSRASAARPTSRSSATGA